MNPFEIFQSIQNDPNVKEVKKDIGIDQDDTVMNKGNLAKSAVKALVDEDTRQDVSDLRRGFLNVVESKDPDNVFFQHPDFDFMFAEDTSLFESEYLDDPDYAQVSRETYFQEGMKDITDFEKKYDIIQDSAEDKMMKWLYGSDYATLSKGSEAIKSVQDIVLGD